MTITLPDTIRDELKRKAKAAGFASIEAYLLDLVDSDEGPIELPEPSPGSRTSVSSREELEAKLLEALDTSGDVEADSGFLDRRYKAAVEHAE